MDLHAKLDELIAIKNRQDQPYGTKGFIKTLCYLASLRAANRGYTKKASHWLREYYCWKDLK